LTVSYTVRYLKIYLWKTIAIVLNLLSLFIVIPKLSSSPTVFGIYSVIVSSVIFLSYADFGFVSAGNKYAAEAYIRGEVNNETRIQGFASFILLIFICIFSGLYFYASYNPSILIRDVEASQELHVATKLLAIQGLFCFITVLQRLNDSLFGIRIEEYIFRQIQIIGSLVKIGSVFFFFHNAATYDIVGYFLCTKIVDLLVCMIGLVIAKKRFHYPFLQFVKNLKYSKEVFNQTKKLAFASFLETILWIVFYELDGVFISKYFGASKLAIYTIALTLATYYRNLSALIFAPFQQRFNHFVGLGDREGLKVFYLKVVQITMPVAIISTLLFALLAKPFIFCWVGNEYEESVSPAVFLILGNLLLFFHMPGANLILALARVRQMILINLLTAVLFWIGVFFTIDKLDILSLALFKFICFITAAVLYMVSGKSFLQMSFTELMKSTIVQILVPVVVIIAMAFFVSPYLPSQKSYKNLFIVIFTGLILVIIFFTTLWFTSSKLRGIYQDILFRSKLLNFKKYFSKGG
jgi:O-antigen/teichoic acid export membrane protein